MAWNAYLKTPETDVNMVNGVDVGHCYDDWMQATITVPVGGQTPYPGAISGQPDYAPDVVLGPSALLTLTNTNAGADLRGVYNDALKPYGVVMPMTKGIYGGQYGDGVINSGVCWGLFTAHALTGMAARAARLCRCQLTGLTHPTPCCPPRRPRGTAEQHEHGEHQVCCGHAGHQRQACQRAGSGQGAQAGPEPRHFRYEQ